MVLKVYKMYTRGSPTEQFFLEIAGVLILLTAVISVYLVYTELSFIVRMWKFKKVKNTDVNKWVTSELSRLGYKIVDTGEVLVMRDKKGVTWEIEWETKRYRKHLNNRVLYIDEKESKILEKGLS